MAIAVAAIMASYARGPRIEPQRFEVRLRLLQARLTSRTLQRGVQEVVEIGAQFRRVDGRQPVPP